MSVVRRITESIIGITSSLLKANVVDNCDLEVVDDEYTFVTRRSAMVTIIAAPGMHAITGKEEQAHIQNMIKEALDSAITGGMHSAQIVFERNPQATRRRLDEMLAPSKQSAKRLQVDLDCVVDETVQEIERWTVDEGTLIALWTHPDALSPDILKRELETLKKQRKETPLETLDTMDPFVLIPLLRSQHQNFVRNFMEQASLGKLHARALKTHEAARRIRMQMDPEMTAENWAPSLPGDTVIPRARAEKLLNGSKKPNDGDLLWPTIAEQLVPRSVEPADKGTVRVGNIFYAPVTIERYMRDKVTFQDLHRLMPNDLPWRMSITLNGVSNMGTLAIKRQLAILGALTSAENKAIRDAITEMTEKVQLGESYGEITTILMTWAHTVEEARARQGMLVQAIQNWGQCDASPERADPAEIMLKSACGMTHNPPVTRGFPPLTDAVKMMPLTRPASDWEQGNVIFRTADGVIWPYQTGSSVQSRWNDIMFAPPGQGKTVTSCRLNTALVLTPGLERLPRLGVVDIGFGGAGTTRLIKNALPERLRHLVTHHRMKNSKDDAINPFDLQLGAEAPIAVERSFLVNLLTLLGTPAGREKPYDSMAELCGLVVDELYREARDPLTAKCYEAGMPGGIDRKIREYNFTVVEGDTTWWDITDMFFAKGDIPMATRAQRFAVPTLQDAAAIAKRSNTIAQTYSEEGGVRTEQGESLTNAFSRMISAAIRDYPALSRPTVLDFSNARMVVIDLQDVAPPGGAAASKQTAVMYMLARYVIAKDFYLHEEYARLFKPSYQDYQKRRIKSIRTDVKRLVWDEFHRTEGVETVRAQAVIDMREGRKHGVQVGLISQDLNDFTETMIKLASSIYVIGVGSKLETNQIKEKFTLSESEYNALETNAVHGPQQGGNAFLFKYETKKGWRSQVLKSTVSPHELWAYSSTIEDNDLFEALNSMHEYEECLKMLTVAFPSGSAKSEHEKIARSSEMTGLSESEATGKIIAALVERTETAYTRHIRQQKREALVA